MGDLVDEEADPADQPVPLAKALVSRLGDLWVLASHRLLCGDARLSADYRKLMGGDVASMMFADPPYNVSVASIQGRGRIKHAEFAAASGEMTKVQFTRFLTAALKLAARHSSTDSIHYVCMDWRHLDEISEAGRHAYTELKNLVVWAKTNAGQGSFYRSQHELIFVFKNGDGAHTNNIELGGTVATGPTSGLMLASIYFGQAVLTTFRFTQHHEGDSGGSAADRSDGQEADQLRAQDSPPLGRSNCGMKKTSQTVTAGVSFGSTRRHSRCPETFQDAVRNIPRQQGRNCIANLTERGIHCPCEYESTRKD